MEFHVKKADRSTTTRRRDFRYIYEQFGKETFGGKHDGMFHKLVETLEQYKACNPEASIDYQLFGDENIPLLVAIVTPLMKRVNKHIKQTGELVFVDATSNTEEHNLKVFLLCTHSVVGALPCALLITSDEKESMLKDWFELVKKCLPEDAFYGRGCDEGPAVMMTDNCDEERRALQFVWPSVKLLLCTFHILQQVWRWLLDKNHQINQSYRPMILSMFKQALYAKSEDVFESCYNKLLNDACDPMTMRSSTLRSCMKIARTLHIVTAQICY
jgi:hypothetical protein